MSEDEDDFVEYSASFEDCTCDHDAEDHGWSECKVKDCPCEGGWVE